MIYLVRSMILTGCAAILVSCGIYTPREGDAPEEVPEDPIQLHTILQGTGRSFIHTMPEFIIDAKCTYLQPSYSQSNADELLLRLDAIKNNYPDLSVNWFIDTVDNSSDIKNVDDMTLYRLYFVYLNGDDTGGEPEFQGKSKFFLKREGQQNLWMILEWEDIPADSSWNPMQRTKSFFNPEYND